MSTQEKNRILAIDYGEKRVGIAVTDPLQMFGFPLTTIQNDSNFWKNLKSIFSEYQVELILLGYPLKENGAKSSSTELVEKFKLELENRINIPIELVDERYSSEIAKENILKSVTSKKKRRNKNLVDQNAAAVLLQEYLAARQ